MIHLVRTDERRNNCLLSLINLFCCLLVLAQVEIAEREQELIKGIELVRQKMVESTAKAVQRIIELNDELAELEVIPLK